MINLVAHHKHMVGENSCGCSNRRVEYLAALLEVILVVGAIVALATTGEWGTLSKIVTIVAGFVVLVDIMRTLVNQSNLAARKTRLMDFHEVKVTKTNDGHEIDLRTHFQGSLLYHVYPVYTKEQAETNKALLKSGEFFFHFATDNSTDLINIHCTLLPQGMTTPKTVVDWLDGDERVCRSSIKSGDLKLFGLDKKLEEFMGFDESRGLYFKPLDNATRYFSVKDRATAWASGATLQDNQCFLYWERQGDRSLSNIKALGKDGPLLDWSRQEHIRGWIQRGTITVK